LLAPVAARYDLMKSTQRGHEVHEDLKSMREFGPRLGGVCCCELYFWFKIIWLHDWLFKSKLQK